MNRRELVASIAKSAKLSLKDTEKFLRATFDSITSSLKSKDKVTLVGFGSFDTAKRAAHMGRNPKTGKAIKINATVAPKFRPGKTLKALVAGKAMPKAKKATGAAHKVKKPIKKVAAKTSIKQMIKKTKK